MLRRVALMFGVIGFARLVMAADVRPRILVTNDDGIEAKGLSVLAGELRTFGDVVVVAPDTDRPASSFSSSIKIKEGTRNPLVSARSYKFKTVERNGELFGYSIDATPSDGVMFALGRFGAERKFDFVVSGINPRLNLGYSALSSGTIAAAKMGAIHGIPSLAVSAEFRNDEGIFKQAAQVARQVIEKLQHESLPSGVLLSINVPRNATTIKPAGEGLGFGFRLNPPQGDPKDGVFEFTPTFAADAQPASVPGTDFNLVYAQPVKAITITPLRIDETDAEVLGVIGGWKLPLESSEVKK